MSVRNTLLTGGVGSALVASAYKPDPLAVPPTVPRDERESTYDEQVNIAFGALMTGPKATRPRWKTIRRIIKQMRLGIPINGRKIRQFDDKNMKVIIRHPTKRRPVCTF